MSRPLIVTRDTQRLQVRLPEPYAVTDPATVTLTVMRKGEPPCLLALPCLPDPCMKSGLRSLDDAHERCSRCSCSYPGSSCCGANLSIAQTSCCVGSCVVERPPTKVHLAESIDCGVATFLLDEDLREAPEGWYSGRLQVNGCAVVVLTIWVRSCPLPARTRMG